MSSELAQPTSTGSADPAAGRCTEFGTGGRGVETDSPGVETRTAGVETAPGPASAPGAGPDAAESDWWVVVLETVSWGDSKRWGVGLEQQVGGDLTSAVKQAQRIAHEYDPQHPMSPRARTVYRADERCWLVVVEGRLVIEPFEVRVVARVGQSGRRGEGARDRGR